MVHVNKILTAVIGVAFIVLVAWSLSVLSIEPHGDNKAEFVVVIHNTKDTEQTYDISIPHYSYKQVKVESGFTERVSMKYHWNDSESKHIEFKVYNGMNCLYANGHYLNDGDLIEIKI